MSVVRVAPVPAAGAGGSTGGDSGSPTSPGPAVPGRPRLRGVGRCCAGALGGLAGALAMRFDSPEMEAAWAERELREHWGHSTLVALAGVVAYGAFCFVDVATAATDPVRARDGRAAGGAMDVRRPLSLSLPTVCLVAIVCECKCCARRAVAAVRLQCARAWPVFKPAPRFCVCVTLSADVHAVAR